MAKLTKTQRARIITALLEAERTQAFLLRDDVRVCLTKQAATITLDYTNPAGDPVLVVITKEIGSLTGLYNAVTILPFVSIMGETASTTNLVYNTPKESRRCPTSNRSRSTTTDH